jgi:disulfide bond formation protein DsbB
MTANPFAWSFRAQYLAGFVLSYAMIGAALYIEHGMLMMPCPLCMLQRIAFAALGFVFLLGGLHAPKGAGGRRAYGVLALVPAAAGAYLAGKHVWIQSLPASEVPQCTNMSLDFMVEAMGPLKALATAMQGSGECAKVDAIFGVSIPVWALAWFVVLGGFALYAAFRRR